MMTDCLSQISGQHKNYLTIIFRCQTLVISIFSICAVTEFLGKFWNWSTLQINSTNFAIAVERLLTGITYVAFAVSFIIYASASIVFTLSVCPFVYLFVREKLNTDHTFGMVSYRAFIFHMCIPCGNTFLWKQGKGHPSRARSNIKVTFFHTKTLTFTGINFRMVHRAFTFHIGIPYGKTFSVVPRSRSSVKSKATYKGHIFLKK